MSAVSYEVVRELIALDDALRAWRSRMVARAIITERQSIELSFAHRRIVEGATQ